MNKLDKVYTDLLQDILDNGTTKMDRTGTGTISVFGRQIRHNMKDGFPLLTTKKMPFKTIVTELIWFLRGDTNIKYLVDNGCNIWTGDAYKAYVKYWEPNIEYIDGKAILTQEEFINKIKTDDEFAKKFGELGPIYGKQWRSWDWYTLDGADKVDQIQNLINDLKTNPDSRRLMVNAWNVGELDQMTLPPCHYGFQVYTREIDIKDELNLIGKIVNYKGNEYKIKYIPPVGLPFIVIDTEKGDLIIKEDWLDSPIVMDKNIPTKAISLMWNQRSVDTFLGLPFNIASYGLLLEIIAKEVNMIPDELIGNLGDVHLYSNHIEQAKEQIGRELSYGEKVEYARSLYGEEEWWNINDKRVIEILQSNKQTREPFPLPKLRFTTWTNMVISDGRDLDWIIRETDTIDDWFRLENYQSHQTIKAPLSN